MRWPDTAGRDDRGARLADGCWERALHRQFELRWLVVFKGTGFVRAAWVPVVYLPADPLHTAREAESEVLPIAEDSGLGVLVRSPMMVALLTGTADLVARPTGHILTDRRSSNRAAAS